MKRRDTICTVRLIRDIAYTQLGGGVLTPRGLIQTGEDALEALGGARPVVFVADFRRLVIALKPTDLDALFEDADPDLCVPAALVVAEPYLPIFRAHAWNVAQAGILRKVFTCPARAEQWATMRVRVHRLARTAP